MMMQDRIKFEKFLNCGYIVKWPYLDLGAWVLVLIILGERDIRDSVRLWGNNFPLRLLHPCPYTFLSVPSSTFINTWCLGWTSLIPTSKTKSMTFAKPHMLPYSFEDRTGSTTNSDFDDIYDRMFFHVMRQPGRSTTYIYEMPIRASHHRSLLPLNREPSVILEFLPDESLGNVTFVGKGHFTATTIPMARYLRKTSLFGTWVGQKEVLVRLNSFLTSRSCSVLCLGPWRENLLVPMEGSISGVINLGRDSSGPWVSKLWPPD